MTRAHVYITLGALAAAVALVFAGVDVWAASGAVGALVAGLIGPSAVRSARARRARGLKPKEPRT